MNNKTNFVNKTNLVNTIIANGINDTHYNNSYNNDSKDSIFKKLTKHIKVAIN